MSKTPSLALRVLYVSTAGRQVVKVEPKDGVITVPGKGAWRVDHLRILPGKGPFDCICVEGQGEALPIWAATRLTAAQVDNLANDNLLRQIKELAQGGEKQKVNWLQVGISALLLLAIVGMGFKLSGDIEDIQKDLHRSHPILDQPPQQSGGDTTVVHGGQQQQQSGGASS